MSFTAHITRLCYFLWLVKVSFMFVTIFLVMKIQGAKALLTLPVPSILKLLIEIKMDIFLSHQKERWKEKNYVISPPYSGLERQGLRMVNKKELTNSTITKIFYQMKLTFSESYCQILQTFSGRLYETSRHLPAQS